jgi:hypothetical protein
MVLEGDIKSYERGFKGGGLEPAGKGGGGYPVTLLMRGELLLLLP